VLLKFTAPDVVNVLSVVLFITFKIPVAVSPIVFFVFVIKLAVLI